MSVPTTTLNTSHRAEFHASGIDDAIIEVAGIYSANGEIRDILGNPPRGTNSWGDGWVIPFRDANGNDVDYKRVKLDYPRQTGDRVAKYESPKGSINRAYFPPSFDTKAAEINITEGEKKALKLQQEGFNTIGITGVWNWQKKRKRDHVGHTYGKRELLDELQAVDWQGKRVNIIFDSDAATNTQVQLAAQRLCEELVERSAKPYVIFMPMDGNAKVGADDFLGKHDASALRKLIDDAPVPEFPEPPDAMAWAKMLVDDELRIDDGIILRWHHDAFYRWDSRRYLEIKDSELTAIVLKWLDGQGTKANPRLAADIVRCLTSLCHIPFYLNMPLRCHGESFSPTTKIAMANGLVDTDLILMNRDIDPEPLTPNHISTVALPYIYDEHAKCPRFEEFLREVMENDDDCISLLQEWFGYCLTHNTSQHKAMIFEGEGANGKSVFLQILEALVGPGNCSHVGLEVFGQRFALGSTIGKLVNIIPEVGEMARADEGIFKAFVAADNITIDRKHREPVELTPTARIVIATNTRPRWIDRSEGLWRRLLLVPFRVTIPEEKQDKTLAKTIINSELPGIFNWAINGLARLRKQGQFTEPQVCTDALTEYVRESNPSKSFLQDHCEEEPGAEVRADCLFKVYSQWSKDNGYRILNECHFGSEVRRAFPTIERFQRRINGKKKWHYAGIRCQEADEIVAQEARVW